MKTIHLLAIPVIISCIPVLLYIMWTAVCAIRDKISPFRADDYRASVLNRRLYGKKRILIPLACFFGIAIICNIINDVILINFTMHIGEANTAIDHALIDFNLRLGGIMMFVGAPLTYFNVKFFSKAIMLMNRGLRYHYTGMIIHSK